MDAMNNVNNNSIVELTGEEIDNVSGGVIPIAIGLAALAVTSFGIGYQIGRDLARK